jgi:hypothetical protein
MGLLDDLKRYRTPVLIGAGGLIALTAYQRTRASQSAAAAAAAAPVTIAPQGLSPEAALGVQSAAFQAGGGLGLQGAALGLGVAESGLELGQVALGIAQGVTGNITGLAETLGEQLANVSGVAIGTLPDLSPTPQPAPIVNVTYTPPPAPVLPLTV